VDQPENAIVENLPDVDVRAVAIIWGDGEPFPKISTTNCSDFEALGLMQSAIRRLQRVCATSVVLEGEDEFDDEDDDDEY
jgi:hypothetical protein